MGDKKISNLLAIILMIIWGISYLSIKVVVTEIEPTLSAFYRFIISSTILFVIMKIKYPQEKILKEDRAKMALGGLFGVALYFFFENYSIYYTSASNVAILISSIPIFTLISQHIIFKEKITGKKLIGATLSVVGLVIVITAKHRVSLFSKGTLGDLMALGAAVIWVIYNIITSKYKGNYKSITITAYQSIWGCLFLSPSLLFSRLKVPSGKVIINVLFLAIFCSCIAYVLYIYCLEKLGATVINTYINLQPIISLISAWILLKESISIIQIVGSLIIILGVFFVSMGDKFNKEKFETMV